METRELGKTGIKQSVLSFGASSLGQEFRPVSLESALRSVQVALDLGINHIDTSPFYGRGMSEVLLGIALREVPRDRYTISTKLGRYDTDKFDFSAKRVVESVDVSLHRLGIDTLDIILCHDLEYVDMSQIVQETLPALRKVQEQGKVRFVGVAGYPMKMFEYVIDHAEVDLILSYCHYTLQNRRLVDLLPRLKEREVGVMNAAPFAMRLLTHLPLPEWHPAPAAIREACHKAAEHCKAKGTDIAKLALQFSIRQRDLSTTIVGSANPDNVRKWIQWAEQPFDEELVAEVEKILAPVMNKSWVCGLPQNN